jgi:hypothetical protein
MKDRRSSRPPKRSAAPSSGEDGPFSDDEVADIVRASADELRDAPCRPSCRCSLRTKPATHSTNALTTIRSKRRLLLEPAARPRVRGAGRDVAPHDACRAITTRATCPVRRITASVPNGRSGARRAGRSGSSAGRQIAGSAPVEAASGLAFCAGARSGNLTVCGGPALRYIRLRAPMPTACRSRFWVAGWVVG